MIYIVLNSVREWNSSATSAASHTKLLIIAPLQAAAAFIFALSHLFSAHTKRKPVSVRTVANVMNAALLIYCTMCSEVWRHQSREQRGTESNGIHISVKRSKHSARSFRLSWCHKDIIKASGKIGEKLQLCSQTDTQHICSSFMLVVNGQ